MKLFFGKIKRRIRNEIVDHSRGAWFYPFLYRSYWHILSVSKDMAEINPNNYFSARPDPGAGIGHQMANWIAGYWWAKQFGLRFAHFTFSSPKWESFLGFGENEILFSDLEMKGFTRVKLPLFGQNNKIELERTKRIIQSYSNQKVIFLCEQNQGYMEQFGVMKDIQQKFHVAPSRKNMKLIFSDDFFNIAIHVRRGDIVVGTNKGNHNLNMRWLNNEYFTKVLDNVINTVVTEKPLAIYLFSQGVQSDFEDFNEFKNLTYCLEMGAQDSFLHMVMADLLITSKSSFSYKPALLNRGVKVCPMDFWHGYPNSKDWILADENGNFMGNSFDVKL